MPFLHIQVSGEADAPLGARIAATASELTARLLGKDPSLTAVAVAFVPSAHWFIAGRPLSDGPRRSYHWSVTVTDETNTKREKAAYLAAVHAAMDQLLGGVAEHAYVHVLDARATAYGYAGQTQERRFHVA
jgi:4-oxalocrotonate tautomerase